MSAASRLKDFLDGGFARKRKQAIKEAAANVDSFTADLPKYRTSVVGVMANRDESKELFDLEQERALGFMRLNIESLRQLKSGEDGSFYLGLLITTIQTTVIQANIEAVNAIQHLMWEELSEIISALKSQTITKEELSERLESIQKEVESKLPDPESMEDLRWVKGYLKRASKTGGQGA
jgi:hypothetical protein